jgi:tetratricopeptide (TPR) repeat protein
VNDIDAVCHRAEQLADVGRYAQAETIVRTALGQAPDNAELLTMLGYLLRLRERYLDALAACDAAVALAPDRGAAHAQRAWILLDIHRTAEAITAATEAVRIDPHLADRHLTLAEALSADNRVDQAREAAREALRLAPRSASAWATLAEIERFAGNPEAAGEATRQALAIDASSTRGRRMLAMLDADRGVVRRSMRTLAQIARDRPADPDLISLLWPIRRVVVAPRWWLPGAAAVVAAGGLVTAALGHRAAAAETAARVTAALTCAITVGFVLRALVPAGRLPWQALRLSPPLVRRCLSTGLAVIAVTSGLLGGYAAGGPLALPILAVAAAPMLWTCMMGEMLGHGLNDAGARVFLLGWRAQVRDVLRDLRQWPAQTRRDLHAAWHETDADERDRKQRKAALRQPLAVYRSRLRNTVLCAAFGLVTVLATDAAAASRPSTGTTIGLGLFALLMFYLCVRMAVMKAIATPEGLILNGPLWTAIVRWNRVAKVVEDDTANNLSLIPVRAPVLLLTDGRRFKVRQAGAYDLHPRSVNHDTNTWTNHIATELDAIRLTYSSRPDTPLR